MTFPDQPAGTRRRRRLHSNEFKAGAVATCMQPGMSMAAVAMAHGVNANLLRRWVREAETKTAADVPGKSLRDVEAPPHTSVFVPVAADALARRVFFVTEGRDAGTIKAQAADLQTHGCPPDRIDSVSIDMSAAFINGTQERLPDARITFDKLHVVAHANLAVGKTRRIEQRTDDSLKGMRWTLLKGVSKLKPQAGAALHQLIHATRLARTARACGSTRSSCARSSITNRSTSCAPCCGTGALA